MKTAFLKSSLLPIMSFVVLFPLVAEQASAQPPMDRWGSQWSQHRMKCSGMGMHDQGQSMARHRTFMRSGVPQGYVGSKSPYLSNSDVIREGDKLYRQQCSACHGATGMGDGAVASSLSPSPAVLDRLVQMPMAVDEYLLWSISEGGEAFGTDMPAFKEQLSQDDIWKIVAYMRAGFPSSAQSPQQ